MSEHPYPALKAWGDEHVEFIKKQAAARKHCAACEQDEYLSRPDTDLEAAMMGTHAIPHGGQYCKKKR